jgi:hypothetical protein
VLRQSLCVVSQAHSLGLARGVGPESGEVKRLLKEKASQRLDTRYSDVAEAYNMILLRNISYNLLSCNTLSLVDSNSLCNCHRQLLPSTDNVIKGEFSL